MVHGEENSFTRGHGSPVSRTVYQVVHSTEAVVLRVLTGSMNSGRLIDPSRRSLRGRRPAALRRTAFREAGHVDKGETEGSLVHAHPRCQPPARGGESVRRAGLIGDRTAVRSNDATRRPVTTTLSVWHCGPQAITERVLTGGRQIDPAERLRVRSAIAQAMVSLLERGELIREVEGMGNRQAVSRKAKLNGGGVAA